MLMKQAIHKQVRDHIPLQQGLRRANTLFRIVNTAVRDHLPLKQGLRPSRLHQEAHAAASQRPSSIKTRIKTLLGSALRLRFLFVRDHLPLKQGLRLIKVSVLRK